MKKKWPPKKARLAARQDSPEDRELAFNFSLKYLSFRNRSVKEVYDYLIRKHFVEETINHALKRLIDLKFLNDEDFARQWIESRQKYKGKSKYVLKNELRLKGLKDDQIEPLLNEAKDDFETARIAFEKKKKVLGKFPPQEFKKKMGAFLQRRGFSYGVINKLLNKTKA